MRVRKSFKALVSMLSVTVLQSLGAAANADVQLDKIKLPPGFKISVYAKDVPGARSMALSPEGTLFVGTRYEKGKGVVYALRDTNKDSVVDEKHVIAKGLFMPNGVAVRNGSLFVGEVNRIIRYDNIEKSLDKPPTPAVVLADLPSETHHGWKYIRFGPDGMLYVPVGAPCNVCVRNEPFAGLSRVKPDGTGFESFAKGIRNTVGYDWDPDTKEIWFTDNGRDWLGDNLPPDELNHAPTAGMNFGFPYRYGNNVEDPEFGKKAPPNTQFTPPAQCLDPHVAALGLRFYTGKMFPSEYQKQIFICEHGSWNRSKAIGARMTLVNMDKGKCVGYKPFMTGFQDDATGERWGRPVDLLIMPDGSLLVSDDLAGAVYRITYDGPSEKKS